MNPASEVLNALTKIGEPVRMERENTVSEEFWASVQPRLDEADASGPAGWGAPQRYVLYAPADAPLLRAGDEVLCRNQRFHVTHARSVSLSGEILYQHALLMEGGASA